MDDPRLKPTTWQAVVGLLVLTACLLLPAIAVAMYFHDEDLLAVLATGVVAPFLFGLALWQYRGTFQGCPKNAGKAGCLLYLLAAFFVFGYVSTVWEYFQKEGWLFAVSAGMSVFLAMAGVAAILGRANQNRAKTLNGVYAGAPELKPRRTVTLRELLVGVGLVCVVFAAANYLVRSSGPRFGSAPSGKEAYVRNLPAGATDVHWCMPAPLDPNTAFDFLISKPEFERWAAGYDSSLTGPHYGPRTIMATTIPPTRYPERREIINAVSYTWREEDRGRHLVYDEDTGRAYFYSHSR